MNLLGMFGIKVKTKQAAKIVKTDNNSVLDESKPSELKIYQQRIYDKYMGKIQNSNYLSMSIYNNFSCDEFNNFIAGMIHVLKRYHPYALKASNDKCEFKMTESATYHPTDDYKFDFNNPVIPKEVFDRFDGTFTIVFGADNTNHDFLFNISYYKSGTMFLTMKHMNNIVYSEVLMYLFTRGYNIS